MLNRRLSLIVIVVLLASLLLAAHAFAWSFGVGSMRCTGTWAQNVDKNATTRCGVEGYGGDLVLYLWCQNPNAPNELHPPKIVQYPVLMYEDESNRNGRKERGGIVRLDFDIELEPQLLENDPTICDPGNPQGTNGHWSLIKALVGGPFVATVTTDENGPGSKEEVYYCGNPNTGELFVEDANQPKFTDWLDEITAALANHDTNLKDNGFPFYLCSTDPAS